MVIQGNNYDVSYSVNGGGFDSELKQIPADTNESVEAFRVTLPKGKETNITIRVTLMTGSNPTLHNAFVVDANILYEPTIEETYGNKLYYNLNNYINK